MLFDGQTLRLTMLDDQPGVAELCFDNKTESVNKFDRTTLNELGEAIAAINGASDIKGLLVTSGKPVFIVGADIEEFVDLFKEPEDVLMTWISEANKVFNDFEDLPVPTVVAINGVALGGGLEMCLVCDYRVMSDQASIGLPEVQLGIMPGFGGTVRLPRLIGIDNANEWVAGGGHQKPAKALANGAVDAVVSADELRAASLDTLARCIDGTFDVEGRRKEKTSPVLLNDMEHMMAYVTGKAMVAQQAGPNMPAPISAVKSMEKGTKLDRAGALECEAATFAKLAKTTQADAMVGLFLSDQALSKTAKGWSKQGADIKKAAVLGAGIMGGGIAYQSASKGTPILMKDIREEGLDQGMEEAGELLSKLVSRGRMTPQKMASVLGDITPTLDYDDFESVDVIVEAVVENEKVKKMVLAECEKLVTPDTVLASNTSTISITKLAEALERPEQFCGMHFFNPVHKMPLVEVIRGEKSSDETIATTVRYALALGKKPIVVNDCAGFLVNRVLFPYFAGFNMLVAQGVDYQRIDKVMTKFGWPMGPAHLMDVVGMDTGVHAADVLAEAFPDRMKYDEKSAAQLMYENDRYGEKNGRGFYDYTQKDKRGRQQKNVDPATDELLKTVIKETIEISDEDIVTRMMAPMCIELARCIEENVVGSASEADMALIFGVGFPPFRGGALRYMSSIGMAEFNAQCERFSDLGKLYEPTEGMRELASKNATYYS